jgi:hypothetical protein
LLHHLAIKQLHRRLLKPAARLHNVDGRIRRPPADLPRRRTVLQNELRHIKRDVDPVLPSQRLVEPRHRLRNPVQLSSEQIIENARIPRGKTIKVDRLHLEFARRSGEVHSMLRQGPKHRLKIELLSIRR